MKKDYFEWLKIIQEAKKIGLTTEEIRIWLKVIVDKENTPESHAGLEAYLIRRIEAKYN
jgi:DNA-binding transcriptional MerR regulator